MQRQCLVKPILKEQGRSQRWLANRIAMDETLVSRILNGHRLPNAAFMDAVCRELNLPASLLFPCAAGLPGRNDSLHTDEGQAA